MSVLQVFAYKSVLDESIMIHPKGEMNVSTKFKAIRSISCQDIFLACFLSRVYQPATCIAFYCSWCFYAVLLQK